MVQKILLAYMIFCGLQGYAATEEARVDEATWAAQSGAGASDDVGLPLESTGAAGLNPKFRNALDAVLARGVRGQEKPRMPQTVIPTLISPAAESVPPVGADVLPSQNPFLRVGSSSEDRASVPAHIPRAPEVLRHIPSIEAGQMPMAFLTGGLEIVGFAHLVANYPMDVLLLPAIIVATDLILRNKLGFYKPLSDTVRTQVGQLAFYGFVRHPVPTLMCLLMAYFWFNNVLEAKYKT